MKIKSTLTNRSGKVLDVVYEDIDNEFDLKDKKIRGVHGYCFCGDKLVVVYAEKKGYWTPPGGGVELGETIGMAIMREIKEETNMRVISQKIIGCQDIFEPQGIVSQVRFACIVEPDGPFLTDPDGDITEIKLIKPDEYVKRYLDWGEIGDRILARALELKIQMEVELNHTK
ncbi:NUDIX hydrolase [Patescibacteria group bacterium]|nr:MAG: NUDIX hydrolase [Patescibacteria group bacterium]